MAPLIIDATVLEIADACIAAGLKVGNGRFNFTLEFSADKRSLTCYIVHWFRPTPHAFEDCKAVPSGDRNSVRSCLDALKQYAEDWHIPEPSRQQQESDSQAKQTVQTFVSEEV